MAEGETAPDAPKRRSRALMLVPALALLLGGASFYAVYSGMVALPMGATAAKAEAEDAHGAAEGPADALAPAMAGADAAPPSFVALDTLVIALGPDAGARHLKVTVQIETDPALREAVAALKPRFADVLNTFLRAVEASDIAAPHAMIRLRAQMLRRVRLVAPPGAVRALLIEQFVLS